VQASQALTIPIERLERLRRAKGAPARSLKGVYRVEGWLECGGEERGWVYSNPIYIR
jgi:hypothetical protein